MRSRKPEKYYTLQEVEKAVDDMYDAMSKELTGKILASILFMLDKRYGWKGKRLKRLVHDLQEAVCFFDTEFAGEKPDPNTCIDYINEHYGIDLKREVEKF